jgi:ketosteroid isomerase-like protein
MEFRALLDAFSAAVEAGDGRRFAALFAEDGVYRDHFYGDFAGRAAIRGLIEDKFHGEGRDFHWRFHDEALAGAVGYASFRYAFTSTSARAAGRRVALSGIGRFRLRGGLICDYDDAFEGGIMLSQLGVPGEAMAKIFAKWSARTLEHDPALRRLMED